MSLLSSYDAVVAGAGPAGCAAAIVLKQAGLDVCLIDRADDGTRKIGESLPGAAIRLLNRIGINGIDDLLSKEDQSPCIANASAWGSDEWTYQDGLLNPEGGGWHVHRGHFNDALRRHALSFDIPFYTVRIGQVKQLIDETKPYQIELDRISTVAEIRAQWLVDATGRKGWIARQCNKVREKLDSQMAAIAWVQASQADKDQVTRIKSVKEGWWYTALLPDGSRVIGLYSIPSHIGEMMKQRDLFFTPFNETGILPYTVNESNCLEMKAAEAGVSRMREAASEGLVCVGDAALSLDPLSSQGMFFALYSGIRGAEAIINSHLHPQTKQASLDQYQSLVDRVFEANQRTRNYFYINESRYTKEAYWRQRAAGAVCLND
jgi:2-polyprenyl-6-methoxyphenol hydroxylase-like FAD-dependent oxidoreductase